MGLQMNYVSVRECIEGIPQLALQIWLVVELRSDKHLMRGISGLDYGLLLWSPALSCVLTVTLVAKLSSIYARAEPPQNRIVCNTASSDAVVGKFGNDQQYEVEMVATADSAAGHLIPDLRDAPVHPVFEVFLQQLRARCILPPDLQQQTAEYLKRCPPSVVRDTIGSETAILTPKSDSLSLDHRNHSMPLQTPPQTPLVPGTILGIDLGHGILEQSGTDVPYTLLTPAVD